MGNHIGYVANTEQSAATLQGIRQATFLILLFSTFCSAAITLSLDA